MKISKGILLIELSLVLIIMSFLGMMVMPVYHHTYKRQKEFILMEQLRTMRKAIDRFYEKANKDKPELQEEQKYPKNLQELVDKRFLRKIMIDPLTQKPEWRTVSTSDPVDSSFTDGQNVFDVASTSKEKGINGIPYSNW